MTPIDPHNSWPYLGEECSKLLPDKQVYCAPCPVLYRLASQI
jgi:hypothetical protein